MGRYSPTTIRPKPKTESPHPVWRGIGCILMIVVPIISFGLCRTYRSKQLGAAVCALPIAGISRHAGNFMEARVSRSASGFYSGSAQLLWRLGIFPFVSYCDRGFCIGGQCLSLQNSRAAPLWPTRRSAAKNKSKTL